MPNQSWLGVSPHQTTVAGLPERPLDEVPQSQPWHVSLDAKSNLSWTQIQMVLGIKMAESRRQSRWSQSSRDVFYHHVAVISFFWSLSTRFRCCVLHKNEHQSFSLPSHDPSFVPQQQKCFSARLSGDADGWRRKQLAGIVLSPGAVKAPALPVFPASGPRDARPGPARSPKSAFFVFGDELGCIFVVNLSHTGFLFWKRHH